MIIPIALADGTSISVSLSKEELNLVHGEFAIIELNIENTNTICDINCEYFLDKKSSGIFNNLKENSIKTNSIVLQAPLKGVGSINHEITVHCSEPITFFCSDTDFADWQGFITLNYDLTVAEKSAKSFLELNLPKIAEKLNDILNLKKSIWEKINNLEKNVKKTDLGDKLSSIKSESNKLELEYNSILDDYNNEDYLDSEEKCRKEIINELYSLITELNELDTEISERIEEHNQIIELINEVDKVIVNSPHDKISFLNKKNEFKKYENENDNLLNNFKEGLFNTYSNLKQLFINLKNNIITFNTGINSGIKDIILDGKKLIGMEYDKICQNNDCEYNKEVNISHNYDLDDINTICEKIESDLTNAFEEENKKLIEEYERSLS